MTRADVIKKLTPRVCYMGNVKTLDTFEGKMFAEKYIRKHKIEVSTSFSNISYDKPKGKIVDCGYTYQLSDEDINDYMGAIDMIKKELNIYPFVDEPRTKEELFLSKASKVLYKLSNGKKLSKDDIEWLVDSRSLMQNGQYRLLGWTFYFKPFLNTYWVKTCGCIMEFMAPSEVFLKKHLSGLKYEAEKIVRIAA